MSHADYLTSDQLYRALNIRDLSDPDQGRHAIQSLLQSVIDRLQPELDSSLRYVRSSPVVPVRDNYDRLGYDPGDVTRARRYTRYISPAVDRTHVGEPHQVDLWRIRSTPDTGDEDMLTMIGHLVEAVLPDAQWRTTDVAHPYTVGGRQIDVFHDGEWLELAECGRIHPEVLRGSGLDPERWSGLALGMGLERALMLRKGIPDIRYLRAEDPRISAQMLTLDPWRHVSLLPAARRDLSVVVDAEEDEETLGDRIRVALGDNADVIESLEVLSRTGHEELPEAARSRLGTQDGQVNLLIRIMLRPIGRTLTSDEANVIRNAIYEAVHEGPVMELI